MSPESAGAPAGAPVGRRVVLGLLGLGAAGVAAGSSLSSFFGRIGGALSAHDPTGLSALIPGAGWRYYTVTDGFPYRPPATYRLAVTGNVAREITLTTDDLKQRPPLSSTFLLRLRLCPWHVVVDHPSVYLLSVSLLPK